MLTPLIDPATMNSNSGTIAQISSPHVQAIFGYWLHLKGDRPAPELSEIDPTKIPPAALPYVILADIESRPFRIRYRLVGTHGASIFGSYVGRYMDELKMPGDVEQQLTAHYSLAAWSCTPVFGRYKWPTKEGQDTVAEYAVMPLMHEGAVTRLFCAEHVGLHKNLYAEDLVPLRQKA